MRKFLVAAAPALMLMVAASAGHAETSSARTRAIANGTMDGAKMDGGARDVQPSRDLIGKRVMHRHGGPMAGTIENVAMGPDGRPRIALRLAHGDQTLMLTPSSFERRGRQIIVMQDESELQQLAQFNREAHGHFGSSMDHPMGNGQMGNGQMGNGMNQDAMGHDSMNRAPMNGAPMGGTIPPNRPGLDQ